MSGIQSVSIKTAVETIAVETNSATAPPAPTAFAADAGADNAAAAGGGETFAANALQRQGDLRRFDLTQRLEQAARLPVPTEDSAPVGETAPVEFVERHPAAQNLKFSETKSACYLANKENLEVGEFYRFPDGKKWEVVDVAHDSKTGFRAVVLKPADPQDKRVVVAYAHSTTWQDWNTNADQSRNRTPAQYHQAADLARKYQSKYGDNVILTGHSLGGGLSSYASLQTGLRATAINSAPLSPRNLGGNPMFKPRVTRNDRITQYYVPGEVLTRYDRLARREARPGNSIAVPGRYGWLEHNASSKNHLLKNVAPDVPPPVRTSPPKKDRKPIDLPTFPNG